MAPDIAVGGAVEDGDGLSRCPWGAATEEYRRYHDTEWGRAVTGDAAILERLCLEGFQSGLSWLTILRKRPAFRAAFAGFEPSLVAAFGPGDVERLVSDAGIVRHRGKIEAAVANARSTLDVIASEGSLLTLLARYAPPPGRPAPVTMSDVPPSTPESSSLARELRRRGFRFLGPTTVYAAMQAIGLVNDHLAGCFVRSAGVTGNQPEQETRRP